MKERSDPDNATLEAMRHQKSQARIHLEHLEAFQFWLSCLYVISCLLHDKSVFSDAVMGLGFAALQGFFVYVKNRTLDRFENEVDTFHIFKAFKQLSTPFSRAVIRAEARHINGVIEMLVYLRDGKVEVKATPYLDGDTPTTPTPILPTPPPTLSPSD